MKTLLRIVPLMLAAAIARADIVIEQKMESLVINGNMTTRIKGDLARIDMPNPLGGNVITLMNFKSGEMVMLMLVNQQKMAMKMNMADLKKQQEAGQKRLGVDPAKFEPKPTGESEKLGEYTTEIFETSQGGMQVKLWIVKDYPNAKAIKDQMLKLSATMGGRMGFDAGKFDVPGMAVKTEVITPLGKMTVTLVKAAEEAVDDAEFKQPEGYQEMKIPTFAAPEAPAPPK